MRKTLLILGMILATQSVFADGFEKGSLAIDGEVRGNIGMKAQNRATERDDADENQYYSAGQGLAFEVMGTYFLANSIGIIAGLDFNSIPLGNKVNEGGGDERTYWGTYLALPLGLRAAAPIGGGKLFLNLDACLMLAFNLGAGERFDSGGNWDEAKLKGGIVLGFRPAFGILLKLSEKLFFKLGLQLMATKWRFSEAEFEDSAGTKATVTYTDDYAEAQNNPLTMSFPRRREVHTTMGIEAGVTLKLK